MSHTQPLSFKAYQPYAPEGATSTSNTDAFPASLDFRRRSYITSSSSSTDLPTLRLQHEPVHHAKQQPPKLHINTGATTLAPATAPRPRAVSWSPGMSPAGDKASQGNYTFLDAQVSNKRERPRSELPKTTAHKEQPRTTSSQNQSTFVPSSLVPGFNTPPQSLAIGHHGAHKRAPSTTSSTDGTREAPPPDLQSILIAELESEVAVTLSRPSSEKSFVAWPGPAPSSLGVTNSKDHRKSWSYYQSIPAEPTPKQAVDQAYMPYSGAQQAPPIAASTKTFQPFMPPRPQIAHPPSMIPGLGCVDGGAYNQTNYRHSMPAGSIKSQSENNLPSLLGLEGFEESSASQHLPPERPTAPHRRVPSFQKPTPPVSKPGTPESVSSRGHGSPYARPVQTTEVETKVPALEIHTNTNLAAPARPKRPVSAPMGGLPLALLPGHMQGATAPSAPKSGSVPAAERRAKQPEESAATKPTSQVDEDDKEKKAQNTGKALAAGGAGLALGGGLGYLVSSQLRGEHVEESQTTTTVHQWQSTASETNWQPATVANLPGPSSSQPMLPELNLSDTELDLESSSKVKQTNTREADEETSDYEHGDDSDDEDDGRPIHPNAARLNAQDTTYSPAQWVDDEGPQFYRRAASWRINAENK